MSLFGNKRLIIVLVGLVILMSVMGYTSRDRVSLTWPEKFLKDTFSLVQGIFYRPAQAFYKFVQDVQDVYHVYEENRALKASLDQYAQVSAQLKWEQAENSRLRKALNIVQNPNDYKLRVAEVVARSTDQWNNVITIDKGLKHGIKKDMAVITADGLGLIGRVQSVANFSATVELLTNIDRSNHISAYILTKQETGGTSAVRQVSGVVEEYDPRSRLLVMRKIPLNEKISPKDQVVTSGLGGVIPGGLLIGEVVRVEPGDYGLTQTAYVQPSADFSQLHLVFVAERSFVTTPTGEFVPSSQLDEQGQVVPPAAPVTQAAASGWEGSR